MHCRNIDARPLRSDPVAHQPRQHHVQTPKKNYAQPEQQELGPNGRSASAATRPQDPLVIVEDFQLKTGCLTTATGQSFNIQIYPHPCRTAKLADLTSTARPSYSTSVVRKAGKRVEWISDAGRSNIPWSLRIKIKSWKVNFCRKSFHKNSLDPHGIGRLGLASRTGSPDTDLSCVEAPARCMIAFSKFPSFDLATSC
ncbi:hypothetical protein BDW02DRAFT_195647 [Decorospora gaudefroyi]|uniref:Uncharacterized protein n=1 Tax=Decorospora gaudefroyi TaxID=184978 RepID=A0A6A5KNB9_9PLEO|nr:hypothetical protein BDW02DRAFT_195647 [Decorospora gaudefroyi]